jgi:hypothetical protein
MRKEEKEKEDNNEEEKASSWYLGTKTSIYAVERFSTHIYITYCKRLH